MPEGPVAFVNIHSGNVLEVAEDAGEGAVITQSTDRGELCQRWQLIFVATDDEGSAFYKIVNLCSGLALEIGYESLGDGAGVLQRTYLQNREALHMQWQLTLVQEGQAQAYHIVNRNSKKVLDAEGGETEASRKDGARAIQWTCWHGLNQQWRLIPSPPGEPTSSLNYPPVEAVDGPVVDTSKALRLMRPIWGWFSEKEARLLLAATSWALRELPDDCAVVEIGSYLGRSTALLASAVRDLRPCGQVIAIDPHEGMVSIPDGSTGRGASTYKQFYANLVAAGLWDAVQPIRQRSTDVVWDQPIGLLFVDGLHDYDSVSADFAHFQRCIKPGGFVAFHDYESKWPGVVQFVDEVRNGCEYVWVDSADALVVLQKA